MNNILDDKRIIIEAFQIYFFCVVIFLKPSKEYKVSTSNGCFFVWKPKDLGVAGEGAACPVDHWHGPENVD